MNIQKLVEKISCNNYCFIFYVVASTLTLVASSGHTVDNKAYKSCIYYYYKKVCKNKIINSPERICKLSLSHNINYKKYKISGIKRICKSQDQL